MSIRTDSKKAVPSLLRRLTTMQKDGNIEMLMSELNKIKDLFSTVKENEKKLLDTLTDVGNLLSKWKDTHKFDEFARRILKEKFDEFVNRILKEAKEANPQNFDEFANRILKEAKKEAKPEKIDEFANSILQEAKEAKPEKSDEFVNGVLKEAKPEKFDEFVNRILKEAKEANPQNFYEFANCIQKEAEEAKPEKFDEFVNRILKAAEEANPEKFYEFVNRILKEAKEANPENFYEFANCILIEAKEAKPEKAWERSPSKTSEDEKKEQVVHVICKDMNDSTRKLLPVDATQKETKAPGETSLNSEQNKSESMNQEKWDKDVLEGMDDVLKRFQVSYDILNLDSKLCMLSLSVFPENAVIKKRHAIYWWIGEGFVKKTVEKTAEEVGEDVFNELLSGELILPDGNDKCPVVNKFRIHPWIRQMLVSSVFKEKGQPFRFYSHNPPFDDNKHPCSLALDQQKVKISDHNGLKTEELRTVFNVGASYLSFGSQGLSKMNKLVVLQLGRWKDSPFHHIEVDSEEFLKDLKAQKYLKYLSLRGISRITELHSIAELFSLEILDLKACHNLEKLPNKIAALKRLTHLDVSQCYLLESMPKEIKELTKLQVLKGFAIGNSSMTLRIDDLEELEMLTRLSIHIGSEAVVRYREFERLEMLPKVKSLKISWGNKSDINIKFPPNLEKLDLEGYPIAEFPDWLKPSKLPSGLKKLYIKGGKLKSMNHGKSDKYEHVEIVRLKYLKNLEDDPNLRDLFPSLRYWEKTQVLNHSHSEWSIED